jgi:hypothetical protein
MAQRDNRDTEMGTWHAPPRRRRYAPLSGAAKYPAGARPSKCIIIIIKLIANGLSAYSYDLGFERRFYGNMKDSTGHRGDTEQESNKIGHVTPSEIRHGPKGNHGLLMNHGGGPAGRFDVMVQVPIRK